MDALPLRRTTATGVVLSLVPDAPPAGGHPQDRPMRDALRTLTASTRLGALAAWRALFRARRPVRPAGRLPEHIDALLVATQAPALVEAMLRRRPPRHRPPARRRPRPRTPQGRVAPPRPPPPMTAFVLFILAVATSGYAIVY